MVGVDDVDIGALLVQWAWWKINYLSGLGNRPSGVEHQIRTGEIIGTGNKGGGYKKESVNQVHFKEDPVAEALNRIINNLRFHHKEEMKVVLEFYIEKKSFRKIGKEMGISKNKVNYLMNKARDLIDSHYRVSSSRNATL